MKSQRPVKTYRRDLADTPPSAIAFHIFAWLPIASNPINATGGTGEASNSGGNDDSMFITIFFYSRTLKNKITDKIKNTCQKSLF